MTQRYLPQSFEHLVREQLGLRAMSLAELARRMDTSSQAVIRILTRNNPRVSTVMRVAFAMGCDPRELVP
jgi:transcriptional regulator with XRE-family HTH domain